VFETALQRQSLVRGRVSEQKRWGGGFKGGVVGWSVDGQCGGGARGGRGGGGGGGGRGTGSGGRGGGGGGLGGGGRGGGGGGGGGGRWVKRVGRGEGGWGDVGVRSWGNFPVRGGYIHAPESHIIVLPKIRAYVQLKKIRQSFRAEHAGINGAAGAQHTRSVVTSWRVHAPQKGAKGASYDKRNDAQRQSRHEREIWSRQGRLPESRHTRSLTDKWAGSWIRVGSVRSSGGKSYGARVETRTVLNAGSLLPDGNRASKDGIMTTKNVRAIRSRATLRARYIEPREERDAVKSHKIT